MVPKKQVELFNLQLQLLRKELPFVKIVVIIFNNDNYLYLIQMMDTMSQKHSFIKNEKEELRIQNYTVIKN